MNLFKCPECDRRRACPDKHICEPARDQKCRRPLNLLTVVALRGLFCAVFIGFRPVPLLAQNTVECNPAPTHAVRLTIDSSGIEAKEENGRNLDLREIRSTFTEKLQAAGIRVIDDDLSPSGPEIPPERTGRLEIQLSGSAFDVEYRELLGSNSASHPRTEKHFAEVKLNGKLTIKLGKVSQSNRFSITHAPAYYLEGHYPTPALAPYDRALFEDKDFLKLLFHQLQSVVGLDNASRAVISDWSIGRGNDTAQNVICDALQESRPDAKKWLLKELHVPCDIARRRVASILRIEESEWSIPFLGVKGDSDAIDIVLLCRRQFPSPSRKELIPDICVVLTTAGDEESRVKAADSLARIAAARLQAGDPKGLSDLRDALGKADGKAKAAIQHWLDELDPPFYLQPAYIVGALGFVVVLVGVCLFIGYCIHRRRGGS